LSPEEKPHDLYFQLHTEKEEYENPGELGLQLSAQRGERIYVHCKPCIMVPHLTLTVAFRQESIPVYSDFRVDDEENEKMIDTTGKVINSEVEGIDRRVIGQLQAWHYPEDQVIIFWECDVFRSFYQVSPIDPSQDAVLITLWERFEQHLWKTFSNALLMITPAWDPEHEKEMWKAFLEQRGYKPDQRLDRAFSKCRAY
jgi:hypothetical protein